MKKLVITALEEAKVALVLANRLCDEALPKFNWGASALDANAIKLLNEAPGAIRAALLKLNEVGGSVDREA